MKISDTTKHERRVFASFTQAELFDLLRRAVAAEAGFKENRNTVSNVFIEKRDRPGTSGSEWAAAVELKENLDQAGASA